MGIILFIISIVLFIVWVFYVIYEYKEENRKFDEQKKRDDRQKQIYIEKREARDRELERIKKNGLSLIIQGKVFTIPWKIVESKEISHVHYNKFDYGSEGIFEKFSKFHKDANGNYVVKSDKNSFEYMMKYLFDESIKSWNLDIPSLKRIFEEAKNLGLDDTARAIDNEIDNRDISIILTDRTISITYHDVSIMISKFEESHFSTLLKRANSSSKPEILISGCNVKIFGYLRDIALQGESILNYLSKKDLRDISKTAGQLGITELRDITAM